MKKIKYSEYDQWYAMIILRWNWQKQSKPHRKLLFGERKGETCIRDSICVYNISEPLFRSQIIEIENRKRQKTLLSVNWLFILWKQQRKLLNMAHFTMWNHYPFKILDKELNFKDGCTICSWAYVWAVVDAFALAFWLAYTRGGGSYSDFYLTSHSESISRVFSADRIFG